MGEAFTFQARGIIPDVGHWLFFPKMRLASFFLLSRRSTKALSSLVTAVEDGFLLHLILLVIGRGPEPSKRRRPQRRGRQFGLQK
jgi:hypothetical protein